MVLKNANQQRVPNPDLSDIRSLIITSFQQEWEICIIIPAQLAYKNEVDNTPL